MPNSLFCGPFEKLLDTATKIRRVERRTEGSRELIAVDLTYDHKYSEAEKISTVYSWDVTVILDPSANYLVRRIDMNCAPKDGKRIRRDHEVTQFTEASPGVFFPQKAEFRLYLDGQHVSTKSVRVSELKVNRPIAPEKFRLTFVRGMKMVDSLRRTEYEIDENGTPITPQRSQPKGSAPPSAIASAAGSDGPGTTPRTETKEEQQSPTRWMLQASFTLLVIAGIVGVARRWRSRGSNGA
jgi:hypothetical protein